MRFIKILLPIFCFIYSLFCDIVLLIPYKMQEINIMNKKQITKIILGIISILLSSFLPAFISSVLDTSQLIISIYVTIVLILSFTLVYLLIDKSSTNSENNIQDRLIVSLQELAGYDIEFSDKLRIYSMSTSNILSFFNTNFFGKENIKIEECQILMRYTSDDFFNNEKYEHEIQTTINLWKHLVDSNKIMHLTIIGYDNIPDHYSIIIDDSVVLTDVFNFAKLALNGQTMTFCPMFFSKNNNSHIEVIKRYTKQFDNYFKYYNSHGGILLCDYQNNSL